MTLQEARKWVRYYARDAAGADTEYGDEAIDFALMSVGEQFCRVTRCNRRVDPVTLASGNATVDLTPLGPGFHPERIISAYTAGDADPMDRPDWEELLRLQVTRGGTGRPRALAFEAPAVAGVWPTPDAAYTLRLRWWEPFTSWAPGVDDATSATVTLNCRPDYLIQILPFGPTALLQHNDPQMAYASESWKKYLAKELELKGAGSLGAQTTRRTMARW
jgi:hypothetical protein